MSRWWVSEFVSSVQPALAGSGDELGSAAAAEGEPCLAQAVWAQPAAAALALFLV